MITFHTPSFGDDEFQLVDVPTMQSSTNSRTSPNTYVPHDSHILSVSPSIRSVGTTTANSIDPVMVPMFPPQDIDIPDIMFSSSNTLNLDQNLGNMASTLPYYSHLSMAPPHDSVFVNQSISELANTTASMTSQISPMLSPLTTQVTFATPHPPSMTTINQSQVNCQYGFKTVSPKRGSPPTSTLATNSPIRESSEDSDDSVPLSQLSGGLKRPVESDPVKPIDAKPAKKQKAPKRKKKKDPNEPQKPVSAYALFFRDTQAAIKGQNHNASFGEVSKIVASMWDGLDPDSKAEYKRRTEEAKKEYLKALAAYRASIVSQQLPHDVMESMQQPHHQKTSPPHAFTQPSMSHPVSIGHHGSLPMSTQPIRLATSLPPMSTQPMGLPGTVGGLNVQHQITMNNQMNRMSPQHMGGMQHTMPIHQSPNRLSPPQQLGHMTHMTPEQLSYNQMSSMLMPNGLTNQQLQNILPSPEHSPPTQQQGDNSIHNSMSPQSNMLSNAYIPQQNNMMPGMGMCVRNGCPNPAIDSPAWDNDYCGNDCVITHCRDAFSAWVAGQQTTYTHVK